MKLKDCSVASRSYALIVVSGKSTYKYNNENYNKFRNYEVNSIHYENNTLWIKVKENNYE